MREMIVDLFAGGGGASLGIEQALGVPVDLAINHNALALETHRLNHPDTFHGCADVWGVDPRQATGGRPVGLLWASPDCTQFSKAKGGKPRKKNIRSLAWVVVRWAKSVRPRIILVENVEEFRQWGPLDQNDRPCPRRLGDTYHLWCNQLRGLGYKLESRELRACDYGAPTIRKRLFIIARCDGRPIVWPEPTHGPDGELFGLQPYRTAVECIDWSIPCPSIFERKRPLAENAMRRIARGIMKYVITTGNPFIVKFRAGSTGSSIVEPMHTVTAGSHQKRPAGAGHAMGLCVPTLIQMGYGERDGQAPRVPGLGKPLGTCVGTGKHALVAAFLAKHFGGVVGADLMTPMPTVTAIDHNSLVTAELMQCEQEESHGSNGCGTEPCQSRSPLGGRRRSRLEMQKTEKHGRECDNQSATRRDQGQERVSIGSGEPYGEGVLGLRSPLGVVCDDGANSTRHGFEPQGRQQAEQQSPQLGGCHSQPESQARLSDGSITSDQSGEGYCGTSEISAKDRSVVSSDCGTTRHISNNGFPCHQAEVAALLIKYYGSGVGQSCRSPMHTVTAKDRLGLVTVYGQDYQIADIGLRMLKPRELARAQGFPDSYAFAGSQSAQVSMIGNSVPPDVVRVLVQANVKLRQVERPAEVVA